MARGQGVVEWVPGQLACRAEKRETEWAVVRGQRHGDWVRQPDKPVTATNPNFTHRTENSSKKATTSALPNLRAFSRGVSPPCQMGCEDSSPAADSNAPGP